MDVEKAVKVYVKIRDKRAEIKREYEEQDRVLREQQDLIEASLLEQCKSGNVTSLSTPYGTATRSVKTTYWTSDWDSMYRFIEENSALHLLEKRIAQSNLKEFLENNPDKKPEGLNAESKYTILVRRK